MKYYSCWINHVLYFFVSPRNHIIKSLFVPILGHYKCFKGWDNKLWISKYYWHHSINPKLNFFSTIKVSKFLLQIITQYSKNPKLRKFVLQIIVIVQNMAEAAEMVKNKQVLLNDYVTGSPKESDLIITKDNNMSLKVPESSKNGLLLRILFIKWSLFELSRAKARFHYGGFILWLHSFCEYTILRVSLWYKVDLVLYHTKSQ